MVLEEGEGVLPLLLMGLMALVVNASATAGLQNCEIPTSIAATVIILKGILPGADDCARSSV